MLTTPSLSEVDVYCKKVMTSKILMGGDTWVEYQNIKMKEQSKQWVQPKQTDKVTSGEELKASKTVG